MATNTSTADVEDEVETVKTRERVNAASKPANERVQLMFSLPAGLRAIIEQDADKRDLGYATVVRMIVADHYEYELPATERKARASKYATEDERKAAQKERNKERNDTIKKLLDLYNKGEIKLDDLEDDDEDEDED